MLSIRRIVLRQCGQWDLGKERLNFDVVQIFFGEYRSFFLLNQGIFLPSIPTIFNFPFKIYFRHSAEKSLSEINGSLWITTFRKLPTVSPRRAKRPLTSIFEIGIISISISPFASSPNFWHF